MAQNERKIGRRKFTIGATLVLGAAAAGGAGLFLIASEGGSSSIQTPFMVEGEEWPDNPLFAKVKEVFDQFQTDQLDAEYYKRKALEIATLAKDQGSDLPLSVFVDTKNGTSLAIDALNPNGHPVISARRQDQEGQYISMEEFAYELMTNEITHMYIGVDLATVMGPADSIPQEMGDQLGLSPEVLSEAHALITHKLSFSVLFDLQNDPVAINGILKHHPGGNYIKMVASSFPYLFLNDQKQDIRQGAIGPTIYRNWQTIFDANGNLLGEEKLDLYPPAYTPLESWYTEAYNS